MTTVVTRIPKGSPLTWLEEDTNFNNLNNYKLESVAVSTTASRITKSGSPITTTDGTGGTIALDLATTAVTPASYTNTNLTVDAYGRLTSAANGTSPAPVDATYVTLSANGTLTNERVLTAGTGITLTDAGANSTITVSASGTSGEAWHTANILSEFHPFSFFGGNGTNIAMQGFTGAILAAAGSNNFGHAWPDATHASATRRRGHTQLDCATAPGFGIAWPSYASMFKVPSGTITGGFYILMDWFYRATPTTKSQLAVGISAANDYSYSPIEDIGDTLDSFLICYPSGGGNIRVARRVSGTTTMTDTGVAMPAIDVGHRWIVYCNPANGYFTATITKLTDATNAYDNVLYTNTFTTGNPAASVADAYYPVWGGPETISAASIGLHRVEGWYRL